MGWFQRTVEPEQLEQSKHPVAGSFDVPSVRPAVVLVDDALRTTTGRTLVSRSEAIGMLHRVKVAAHDLPAGEQVIAILDRLDRDSADQVLVPQRAVVDALLDVRCALCA